MTDDIEGFAGVILGVAADRFEAMRRFYVEQVGLTPQSSREGHVAFSWGTPPDHVRLIVAAHSDVTGANPDPARVMVNLLTHNIERAAARMRAAGVDIDGPRAQSWGGWIATFHDPDGNTVQLLQPASGVG
ncbi:MAG: VOC family protein [Dehalococcoidia bacterium]